jgi:putative SOS response-associated peptidase YedK
VGCVHSAPPGLWGLLPHWAKDSKVAFTMINAREETLIPGHELFAFAGLWMGRTDGDTGEAIESCTIITTRAPPRKTSAL